MKASYSILRLFIWTGIGTFGLLTGCQKTPPSPLLPPTATISADHFFGSPLTGPLNKPLPNGKPADALSVSVRFLAIDRIPPGAGFLSAKQFGESLPSKARLIAITRNSQPIHPSAKLAQRALIGDSDDASKLDAILSSSPNVIADDRNAPAWGRTVSMGKASGALPRGATVRLIAKETTAKPEYAAGHLVNRRVELELHRPNDTTMLQIAVLLEDLVQPYEPILDNTAHVETAAESKPKAATNLPTTAPTEEKVNSPPPRKAFALPQQELLVFDRPAFAAQDEFVIIVPFKFANSESTAVAAFVKISYGSATDAEHLQAYTSCLTNLKASATKATERPYSELLDNPENSSLLSALQAMAHPATARQAMVFLADQADVAVFEDLALVGDDWTLTELSKKLFTKLGSPMVIRGKDHLAWLLEATGFSLLTEQLSTGKMLPEHAAILTLHAGEAGRHAGSLDDALKTSVNRRDFKLKLIAENYIYLEDSSPASRVRAFEWLQARDLAPKDFDPLGPPKERRAALERAFAPAPVSVPAMPNTPGIAPANPSAKPASPALTPTSLINNNNTTGGIL